MNISDIIEQVKSGKPVTVVCLPNIDNTESSLESNMIADIIDIIEDRHDCYKLWINMQPYYEHNKHIISRNYYDANGVPALTSEEAGYYPKNHIETIYIDKLDAHDCGQYFKYHRNVDVLMAWKATGTDLSYIEWLENEFVVLQMHKTQLMKTVDNLLTGIEGLTKR
jgi:hypothetical protein